MYFKEERMGGWDSLQILEKSLFWTSELQER